MWTRERAGLPDLDETGNERRQPTGRSSPD
jgi:hypothetical protein